MLQSTCFLKKEELRRLQNFTEVRVRVVNNWLMVCLLSGRLKTLKTKKIQNENKRIRYSSISHPENHLKKEATAGHSQQNEAGNVVHPISPPTAFSFASIQSRILPQKVCHC